MAIVECDSGAAPARGVAAGSPELRGHPCASRSPRWNGPMRGPGISQV